MLSSPGCWPEPQRLTRHSAAPHTCIAQPVQAAMNSINLGFDIGVNTDVGPALLASDLIGCSEEKLELFMGSLNLWAIAGALAASLLADQLGRRKSFAVASVGFLVGVSCMATAQSFTQLMGGRVLVGLGVGFGFAVDPVYIAEISPPHARGRLVTWSEIGTNIGILVGWCAGYALSGLPPETSWRVMLGTGCVLPVVMLFLVAFVMPESPRWLIRMGRIDEAKSVLTRVNPPGADIDGVVRSIQDNIVIETRESGSVTWHQMFHPTPALRRMLVVGIGVAVCQQLVGIDAIQYFLLFILKQSGVTSTDDQFRYLIMIGVLKLGCIFVAGALFDTRGRRPLMFASCAGMATAMLILAAHMASLSGESVSDGEDTIAIPRACVSWHEGHDVCAITAGVKGDCIETCIDAPTPFCARYAGGTIGIPPPAASASDSDGNTGSSAASPIFALCMYMMSFSLGMGPGAWLIPSEVFSNAVRAKAMSMATVANRLV